MKLNQYPKQEYYEVRVRIERDHEKIESVGSYQIDINSNQQVDILILSAIRNHFESQTGHVEKIEVLLPNGQYEKIYPQRKR